MAAHTTGPAQSPAAAHRALGAARPNARAKSQPRRRAKASVGANSAAAWNAASRAGASEALPPAIIGPNGVKSVTKMSPSIE